jgi:3-deoxy-D-manno-octulosonate 8-phosphate phosphatase (KDO 8-P phosphatase)
MRTLEFRDRLLKIKLLAMDVDGTLTNRSVYYSNRGEELKRFNVHDGMGITLLHQSGIQTLIISSDPSDIPTRRVEKLGVTYQIIGAKRKFLKLQNLLQEIGIAPEEVAYIGDDVNDLEVIDYVGFSAAPKDATETVRNKVDYVLDYEAGGGAVRQLCELILLAQDKPIILEYKE